MKNAVYAYKDKAKGTWYAAFRYKDMYGKEHSTKVRGFKTKKEAIKAGQEKQKELNTFRKTGALTIDDGFNLYLKTTDNKPSSMYNRTRIYNKHIKDLFGDMLPEDISVPLIAEWQNSLVKKGYTNTYIHDCRGTFSVILHALKIAGALTVNPLNMVPCPKNKKIKRRPENFWEPEEFEQFIDAIKEKYPNDAFTYNVLWYTGMRFGEASALKWENIDWENKKISIVATRTLSLAGSRTEGTPKSYRSTRTIDIPNKLMDILSDQYEKDKHFDGFNDRYYVLGNLYPACDSTVRDHLKRDIELAGAKSITLHGFRHSHASYLINQGLDDVLIAKRMGHSVDELHKTYEHIYNARHSKFSAKIDEIF